MSKSPTVRDFGKELYDIWITERPTQLAAAIAYYGMFSFAPVIYIALTVAGIFLNELFVETQFFERLENALGPDTAQFIEESVYSISQTTSGGTVLTSVISFLALLFAASGLFFQLQYALNTIWKVPPPEKGATLAFIRQRLFSFVMVIGVGLLLVVLATSNIIFSWIGSFFQLDASGQVFSLIAFLGIATISFALFFKVLPDIKIAWRDVWIGAAVTALLITVGGFLITLYLKSSSIGSALEVAGSFAVVLLGIYYVATIFLVGAIFTRVYAHMFGSWRESTVEGE